MMKQFVYQVGNVEFVDVMAFGEAWEQAKALAAKLHCPIFRLVIKGGMVKQQVYYKGGIFNAIEFMRDDNVKIW